MPKFNIDRTPTNPGPKEYFIGKVETKRVINDSVSKDIEVGLISFKKGARTRVHYHDSDQVLMAAEGEGVLAVQTKLRLAASGKAEVTFGDVEELTKGDLVCIPAFAWHWHGAKKGHDFAHYQIKRPCKTVWLE